MGYNGIAILAGKEYWRYTRQHLLPSGLQPLIGGEDEVWVKFWTEQVKYKSDEVWVPKSEFPNPFPLDFPQSFVDRWFDAQSLIHQFTWRTSSLARACISNPSLFRFALRYRRQAS